jgi:protein-tyrosine phosphatase
VIDIHSHILPMLDDGAQTLEESIQMLKLAAAAGTTDIIATPHANALYSFDELEVRRAFSTLCVSAGLDVRLHLGCELHLNYANLQSVIERPDRYTLNRSRYLLLELPNLFSIDTATQAIQELIRIELIPVIAHPERNMMLQRQIGAVVRWKELGCLMQITAQSLNSGFGAAAKRAAEELMKKRLVDFVASDAHDCIRRPPDLRLAYKHVASTYGAEVAEHCFMRNPAAVLSNGSLSFIAPKARIPREFFHSGLSLLRSIKNAGRSVAGTKSL